jgi:hypothetical protein
LVQFPKRSAHSVGLLAFGKGAIANAVCVAPIIHGRHDALDVAVVAARRSHAECVHYSVKGLYLLPKRGRIPQDLIPSG